MKMVLSGKTAKTTFPEGVNDRSFEIEAEPEIVNEFINTPQESLFLNQTQTEIQKQASDRQNGYGKKTRGRPPKAGPSKVSKKTRITNFYIGKLSNVVSFKKGHCNSLNISDSESSLFY